MVPQKFRVSVVSFSCLVAALLVSLGGTPAFATEPTMTASVDELPETAAMERGGRAKFELPAFRSSWGLARAVYDKAADFMGAHGDEFRNQRYVMLVDMSQHSSKKRLYLFDLEKGSLERHKVAHGKGSDPKATGFARLFSNEEDSDKTSLGAYVTTDTYDGEHGLELRLDGLEATNDHARERAIVLHGASYVKDGGGEPGRSWGCPAVDRHVVKSLIARLKDGAMLVIWK